MLQRALAGACALAVCAPSTYAQTPPTARSGRSLAAVRAAGPIVLDGTLDEPSWTGAPLARGFVQNEPREGAPATYDTDVRVVYDDNALYIGVFAKDAEPSRITVNDLKKDFNAGSDDGFSVVLDTFHDGRNGYMFTINPRGAKRDAQMANEGRETNVSWDGIWDVATRVVEDGWYAEIRIPFRTLRFPSVESQTWGINFERRIRRFNEESYWAPLPRIYNIDRVSLAGTLEGLRHVRPGKDLRLKPYATASASTVARDGTEGDFDGGFDVKYGVTSGLTWDFTVNTDFSQVEADEQQVNLTRFSLFFPEKRDFFLENSGIFQFGPPPQPVGGVGRQNPAADMRLFFSRRIGLSNAGDAVPILAGTRLTGRAGAYSLGALNIQQREQGALPATNFTAVRVRRDILANSDIGAVVMNKDESGPRFNRVAGVDANFRFGPYVTANGYAAKTFSPAAVVPGSGNDLSMKAAAMYRDRTYEFRGFYQSIGSRFNDEMGFVPRTGINNTLGYARMNFRPKWASAWLRETFPHYQIDHYARTNGRGVESIYEDYHWPFTFQDGGLAEIGINTNRERLYAPFTINARRAVRVQPGRYTFNEYFVFYNTSSAAKVSLNTRFATGPFYGGHRRNYVIGPSFRPSERLNVSLNVQFNDIELAGDSFVTKAVTGRVNFNFNTKMFVNALVQYTTDSGEWSSNLRFNIIHRPLSDFFLVYNERRDERSGDLVNRALIAKMTYLLAF